MFERDPVSWLAQLDALDTVIFFLNYAQFERLEQTFSQFEALNTHEQAQAALQRLRGEYTGHIVPLENPLNVEARIAALKPALPPDATDLQASPRLGDCTGCAAQCCLISCLISCLIIVQCRQAVLRHRSRSHGPLRLTPICSRGRLSGALVPVRR